MSTTATSLADAAGVSPAQRLEVLFDRLAELTGQRNAIDGEIVEIVAEIDRDGLAGNTGCRSMTALVAWKTGVSPANAKTLTQIARRLEEFPRCADALRQGRVSLDGIGVIAERAAEGSDDHYAQLIEAATVAQLRTAVKLAPKPEPEPGPRPEPPRSITKTSGGQSTTWKITLPHDEAATFEAATFEAATFEAATFEAALESHHDGLIAEWLRDHAEGGSVTTPALPNAVDGFIHLIEAGWDSEVAARPHGHRTTVVIHLDLEARAAALHLGPLLTDDDRKYLTCDATCEVWFHRNGQPLGSGRQTRTINRRLRRALEHRDHGTCAVPGCGATRGLHAHHLQHWEDGGPTDVDNLVLLCPYHHRLHHRGGITITGPASRLTVTDADGRHLMAGTLARPPTTPPPDVPPCPGPTGERAHWWWYEPFQPPPPSTN